VIRVNGEGLASSLIKCSSTGRMSIELELDHEYRRFDFTNIKG